MTATAAFAGRVHAVVVQTARARPRCSFPALLPASAAAARSARASTGSATHTDLEMCPGGYSSSASASAVLELGDQCTGFLPR